MSVQKRYERKQKLKRILNYDAEMELLNSFYNLKVKSIEDEDLLLSDFFDLIVDVFLKKEHVSEEIFDFFKEEIILKEKLKEKVKIKMDIEIQLSALKNEIVDIENQLNDEEPKDSERELLKSILNNSRDYGLSNYSRGKKL